MDEQQFSSGDIVNWDETIIVRRDTGFAEHKKVWREQRQYTHRDNLPWLQNRVRKPDEELFSNSKFSWTRSGPVMLSDSMGEYPNPERPFTSGSGLFLPLRESVAV